MLILGSAQTDVERSLVAGGEHDSVELLRRRVRQMAARSSGSASNDEYLRACYEPDLLDPTYMPNALTDRLTTAGLGPLSWEYVRFLSERPEEVLDDPHRFFLGAHSIGTAVELHLLRQESLNRELYDFLQSVGHSAGAVSFVLGMGRVHPQGGPQRQSPAWEHY